MTSAATPPAGYSSARYRPESSGLWGAVLDGNRALLVRLGTDAPNLETLWIALHSGDGVQSVLDALTANGLAATPHFALLSWVDETVRVFVRGDATVRLQTDRGEQVISGVGVSTWLEQTHNSVKSLMLSDAAESNDSGSSELLPLSAGAVRTHFVSVKCEGATREAAPSIPSTERTEFSNEQTISVANGSLPVDSQRHESEDFEQFFGATIVHGAQAAREPLKPASLEENPSTALPEATPSTSPQPPIAPKLPTIPTFPVAPSPDLGSEPAGLAPQSTPPRAAGATAHIELPAFVTGQPRQPAQARAGDHDGETIMSDDLRALRRKASRVAEKKAVGGAPPSYHLLMPNGSIEALTATIIIGRAPSVSKVSGGKLPRLLSLGSPDQDISRNHLQIELLGDTVVVTDLHSRNGTLVVMPGLQPQRLRAGEPTTIVSGSIVDLGGGVAITLGVSE